MFARRLDRLEVGGRGLDSFEVEVGGVDYGFAINRILGMDFLGMAGVVLDLRQMTLEYA